MRLLRGISIKACTGSALPASEHDFVANSTLCAGFEAAALKRAGGLAQRNSRCAIRHDRETITLHIVRLASGSSRLSASLRPRSAGLAALTRPSDQPGSGSYVMARESDGRSDIGLILFDANGRNH